MNIKLEHSIILAFPEYRACAEKLASELSLPCKEVKVHYFPDGESKVTLPEAISDHIILCRSLFKPNDKLIELILATETAREMGARRITLVAPYLSYMRQDIAFHPGEAVSQKIIGKLLSQYVDDLITVDPHLHRTPYLKDAVPVTQAIALSATPLFSQFVTMQNEKPILLGPDEESEQWVSTIAKPDSLEYGVAHKLRLGDDDVTIQLPDLDFRSRIVILVDDVASTGKTLAVAAENLYSAGATAVDALITHALFANNAEEIIHKANIRNIWSTDSIPHASNQVSLAPILAEAIRKLD